LFPHAAARRRNEKSEGVVYRCVVAPPREYSSSQFDLHTTNLIEVQSTQLIPPVQQCEILSEELLWHHDCSMG
jgi:hypothetical protein